MEKKEPLSKEQFISNSTIIQNIAKNNSEFVFYFSPDPDAVGASIAFALYLRSLDKSCTIYLPDGFDSNLDFLFDVAVYNSINIIKDIDIAYDFIEKKSPIMISCDTPTHFLLPHFARILGLVNNSNQKDNIEIDHHFGGDSEQLFDYSTPLYNNANSCCEILADFFELLAKKPDGEIDYDKFFPRNIVLSLLVGICFDTQFGKFVVNKESYDKWFNFLSERLKWLTWGNDKYLNSAKMVFETISKMNQTKEITIKKFVKNTEILNAVGLLIIPLIDKYESMAESNDSTCIMSKLIPDMSNIVPEYAGAIGILAFYDTVYKLYFIKARRSLIFKEYDLRNLEQLFDEVFGVYFLGGGGHPGATSFRVADVKREDFTDRIHIFHKKLSEKVKSLTEDIKPNFDVVKYEEEQIKKKKKK